MAIIFRGDSILTQTLKTMFFWVKRAIKEKPKASLEPPRSIYADFTGDAYKETVAILPNYKSTARTVQRRKFIEKALATLKDIEIPFQLTFSVRGILF